MTAFLACALALAAAAAVAYQAAARERDYSALLTRGDTAAARRPDVRRHRSLQRRHRPASRLDARLPAARRDLPAARRARRPRRGRARLPRGRGARPDRHAAARGARRRALPAAALRPRRRRLRRAVRARRPVGARQLQAGARPLSQPRHRRGAGGAERSHPSRRSAWPTRTTSLGLCLREKGRTAEALRAFERAVALAPGLDPGPRRAGRPVRHRRPPRRSARAAAGARRRSTAIASSGRSRSAWRTRARGHWDLAVLTLGSALERRPDEPEIYRALGQVWLERPRDDKAFLSKAREALERAASSPGATQPDADALRPRAARGLGHPGCRARLQQDATTRYPIDPPAFLLHASAAEKQGHLGAARTSLIRYGGLTASDADFVSRAARIGSLVAPPQRSAHRRCLVRARIGFKPQRPAPGRVARRCAAARRRPRSREGDDCPRPRKRAAPRLAAGTGAPRALTTINAEPAEPAEPLSRCIRANGIHGDTEAQSPERTCRSSTRSTPPRRGLSPASRRAARCTLCLCTRGCFLRALRGLRVFVVSVPAAARCASDRLRRAAHHRGS